MTKPENRILKKFEATDVTIEIVKGVPMFELYSVGVALGYTRVTKSKGKEYFQIRTKRIDTIIKNAGITLLDHGGTTFLQKSAI